MLNFESFSSKDIDNECKPEAYCKCWNKQTSRLWKKLDGCNCGEDLDMKEWRWEAPGAGAVEGAGAGAGQGQSRSVVISADGRQVTFHPYYSSGTALVRGDTPLTHDHHYYWEVKMLTAPYGTDIMIGVGTERVQLTEESQFKFRSMLGEDGESYGLSYGGRVAHGGRGARLTAGFTRGSLVGVKLDLWAGTIEFFLNRQPQGVVFHNVKRHGALYPMVCSTAAQSSLRLTYAASWRASLLVDAARVLARAARASTASGAAAPGDTAAAGAPLRHEGTALPPGLYRSMRSRFWIMMPSDDGFLDGYEDEEATSKAAELAGLPQSILCDLLPSEYMNGFYGDTVRPENRLVPFWP